MTTRPEYAAVTVFRAGKLPRPMWVSVRKTEPDGKWFSGVCLHGPWPLPAACQYALGNPYGYNEGDGIGFNASGDPDEWQFYNSDDDLPDEFYRSQALHAFELDDSD